jgi:hypothetical protein
MVRNPMSNHDWCESTQGASLLQGDILLDCPVFAVSGSLTWPLNAAPVIEIEAKVFDLVVMTQSCDLENEKVEDVLLAQLAAWEDVVRVEAARGNDAVRSRKFRKLLVDGNVPGLSLLHRRDASPSLPWSVVDFHRLFTLPKAFVTRFAADREPRLRLRSPYREHLAQAFARYFMRVGLPHDAKAFEQKGGDA